MMCLLSYPETIDRCRDVEQNKFDTRRTLLIFELLFANFSAVSITNNCGPCDSKQLQSHIFCDIIIAMQCAIYLITQVTTEMLISGIHGTGVLVNILQLVP